jgi:hypothetical protein
VADTYNHKIKIVDPATGEAETLLGTGKRGEGFQPAEFAEPGGLSVAAGQLYLADTNNHAIKVTDILGRNLQTLEIEGLSPPSAHEPVPDEFGATGASKTSLPTVHVAAGSQLHFDFSFNLPVGCKLNKEAPITCRLRAVEPTELLTSDQLSKRHHVTLAGKGDKASVSIPAKLKSGRAIVEVALTFTYCRDGVGGLCKLGSGRWTVPIEVSTTGRESSVHLTAEVATN